MNIKRAVLLGALQWVIIFFEVSILMFGFGLDGTELFYYPLHYILLTAIISATTLLYFKSKKVKRNAKEGLLLGLVFVIVGIVLDSAVTVPLFVKNYANFFLNWQLATGLALTLAITSLIGAVKNKK